MDRRTFFLRTITKMLDTSLQGLKISERSLLVIVIYDTSFEKYGVMDRDLCLVN